jgi:hypothetical protein
LSNLWELIAVNTLFVPDPSHGLNPRRGGKSETAHAMRTEAYG